MTHRYPAGAELKVQWGVISNYHDGETFLAELTITNRSEQALPASGWTIYFNTCRKTRPGSVQGDFDIVHVNGDLSKLTPRSGFAGLNPGQSLKISYEGIFWVIQETDAPLGFYVVYGDGTPDATAQAIGDPEIAPFATENQRRRKPQDVVVAVTPESRHAENTAVSLLPEAAIGLITPTPLSANYGDGRFAIDDSATIVHAPELAAEAAFLQQALADAGVKVECATSGVGAIRLALGKIDAVQTGAPAEAYKLAVDAGGITITGASRHGVFNGIQSLRQLLPVDSLLHPRSSLEVRHAQVLDAPRFEYRGMHLDVGRNFSSKETVLRMLDLMALYKLNKFHFHVTDDEGWRVEIPGLPELTEIGSKRGFTKDETDNLVPSFGSGAVVEGSHGTGYYSKQDFIEILHFAAARHIEVIPEIDVPGHARAAIKAMEVRYRRLLAEGKQAEAEEFLLTDFDDKSVYESVQLWHDNVVCIAKESCYRFIDKVVSEVVNLYREAGVPLRVMQTGGDEIPEGAWEGSPICQSFMKERGMTSIQELLNYFLGRFRDILKKHELVVAGWEEIAVAKEQIDGKTVLKPNPEFINANFRPYVWNNLWGSGQEDIAYQLANAGYPVVLCNVTNLYFDLAYEKDPCEPGYYWGGFINLRKPFEFNPLDIYTLPKQDIWGHPPADEAVAKMARLTPEGRKHVIGLQGQIWGENARSQQRVEYFLAPRVISFAERAWAEDPRWTEISDAGERDARIDADWNVFANRLGQRELPRLDGLIGGYGYRIPVPGAKIEGGKLHANIDLPGFALRYAVGGNEPTIDSPLYAGPVAVSGNVKLAAFATCGRRGRVVSVG